MHPEEVTNPVWNYIVLGIAFVFDGISFITAMKEFNRQRGSTPFWLAVKQSKDPSTFVVLFEDAADVIGIAIAFTGILLGQIFHNVYFDGIASVMIGILLTLVAILLVRESRSLLMGETPGHEELAAVIQLAENEDAVNKVARHLSSYLAPEEVILILKIKFKPHANNTEMVNTIQSVRESIQSQYPHYKQLFIEPE